VLCRVLLARYVFVLARYVFVLVRGSFAAWCACVRLVAIISYDAAVSEHMRVMLVEEA